MNRRRTFYQCTIHATYELCKYINKVGPTFGDYALQTHHATQKARGEGSRGDVFVAKAALQTDEELFVLLGISSIYWSHQIFQSTLERQELFKSIIQQPEDQRSSNSMKTCSQFMHVYTTVKCKWKTRLNILGCSLFVAAAEVVEVHNEPGFVFADHLSYFALINALVLLGKGKNANKVVNKQKTFLVIYIMLHISGPLFL